MLRFSVRNSHSLAYALHKIKGIVLWNGPTRVTFIGFAGLWEGFQTEDLGCIMVKLGDYKKNDNFCEMTMPEYEDFVNFAKNRCSRNERSSLTLEYLIGYLNPNRTSTPRNLN